MQLPFQKAEKANIEVECGCCHCTLEILAIIDTNKGMTLKVECCENCRKEGIVERPT